LNTNKVYYILVGSIAVAVFVTVILILRGVGGGTLQTATLEFWGVFDDKSAFDKVALMGSKIASGKSLIDYSRLGLSIEYGFGKTGKNYPLVLKDIKTVLVNLEMLPGRKRIFTNKVLYKVFDIYKVKKNTRKCYIPSKFTCYY